MVQLPYAKRDDDDDEDAEEEEEEVADRLRELRSGMRSSSDFLSTYSGTMVPGVVMMALSLCARMLRCLRTRLLSSCRSSSSSASSCAWPSMLGRCEK